MIGRIFRAVLLFLCAMAGVAAILSHTELPPEIIEQTGLSEQTVLLISFANNALIIGICVVIGALTAHRIGLVSLIAHPKSGAGARLKTFPVYALLGVALGLAIAAADQWAFANIDALQAMAEAQPDAMAASSQPPEVRFLYGGITEEVMLRWGLMSLIAWLVWAPTKNRALALIVAIPLAGLLFGAGHLPALFQMFENVPEAMVLRVILLNAVLGIAYGAAYARNSLEAGMMTHAATHAGLLLAMSFNA